MMAALNIARYELLIVRRNLWMAIAVGLMLLFAIALTIAGSAPAGALGVDRLTITVTSLTTLSVYLVPLIALLLSFDAIVGELDRGMLALSLSYPVSRAAFLVGKFLAHLTTLAIAIGVGYGAAGILSAWLGDVSTQSLTALAVLYASAVLLGATFLGLGYAISGLVRQTGAAAGLVIGLWLVGIVLYDLALLGGLIADDGGIFTTKIFPWLLVANPADAFRVVYLAGSEATILA
ncbi:MAG: ABC transporter permease, partial [Alphaproteobacteria bacterium]